MSNSILLPGRHVLNGILFVLTIVLCVLIVQNPDTAVWYAILIVVAAAHLRHVVAASVPRRSIPKI